MAFNDWYDCEVIDLDSGAAIVLDAEYKSLVIDFESREVARKEDTLEAKLQEARSLVLSTRTDLQYRGCHSLWELACRPDNHSGFEDETFALLCRALASEELRVRAAAAAALWTLAEVELTLQRMPIAQLVPALICAARARPGDAPGTRPLEPSPNPNPTRSPDPNPNPKQARGPSSRLRPCATTCSSAPCARNAP